MIEVQRRDEKETTGSLYRRFDRSVRQSGVLMTARGRQFFRKPISRRERRLVAIRRRRRNYFSRPDQRSRGRSFR